MWALVMVMMSGGAAEEIAARLDTLERHYEALQRIEVAAEFRDERVERLEALRARLDAGATDGDGVNALYRDMDAVRGWLWAHAAERPERAPGEFEETAEAWIVRTPTVTLSVARGDLSMSIATPATEWRFGPSAEDDVLIDDAKGRIPLVSAGARKAEAFHTGYSAGMRMTFGEFADFPDFTLYVTAYVREGEVTFDVDADETGRRLHSVNWPKPVILPADARATSVCPVMQGILIPGDWHQELVYGGLTSSREFYMPWFGHIVDGHGIMGIFDTAEDAGGVCVHPAGGPTHLGPRWYASLGQVGYLRTIRYALEEDASYVSLAKRYRQHVMETGRFVSLAEKCVRTPALKRMIGTPIVHLGALYHTVPEASLFHKEREEVNHQLRTFDALAESLRKLKAGGIDRAYVHLDGWGFYGYDSAHPDPLPVGYEQGGWDGLRRFGETCQELDYLFAVHDQYRDFYLNAVSYDERLAATDIFGKRFEVSQWCGGPQTVLSSRYAPEYVRRNHDLFREHGIPVEGAYLDVFSVLPMDESAQPGARVTRSECLEYRRKCFDLLRARGYVVSSEEPTDAFMPTLDLVHHAPFAVNPFPHVWSDAEAFGIPIPLFNLVYHDALITPWDMGERGGWGIPNELSGRLLCLLNAGAPYATPPYGEADADAEQVARVHEAAALAERCAFAEMVNHEFLNAERTKQRTTFSNGVRVTVDFATGAYEIEMEEAKP